MSKIAKSIAVLGVVAGLGVAALPLSSYATEIGPVETSQVTIRATVNNDIAISTNGIDLVDFGDITTSSGEVVQTLGVTVSGSVATYNLGVMDYDDDTHMTNGTPKNGIPAITTNGTLTEGWGFRNEARHQSDNSWEAMPVYNAANAATNLVSGEALTDGKVTTNVQFGINIDGMTGLDGVYEDKVIFTATGTTE